MNRSTRAATVLTAAIAMIAATTGELRAQTFAVIGDFGDGSASELAVANLVKSWNPDFIITTGDNNYGTLTGSSQQWTSYVGNFYGEYILGDTTGAGGTNRYPEQTSTAQRFFPSLGNHDTDGTSGSAAGYLDYFHNEVSGSGRLPVGSGVHGNYETYYDFVIGDAHFFAVDSDHQGDLTDQKAWLQAGLAASASDYNFVFYHHPAYSSCSSHGSDPDMQWPYQEWGATAVFAGHDHVYERIILTDDNHTSFPYFTVGHGGRSLYGFTTPVLGSEVRYSANYGALLVTLDGDQAVYESYSIADGEPMIDRYVQTVPEPATLSMVAVGAVAVLRRRRRKGGRP